MWSDQWEWRLLFDLLRDYRGFACGPDILLPWVEEHPALINHLHEIGAPDGHRVAELRTANGCSFLEGLYALSRIIEVLIAPHQESNDDLRPRAAGRPVRGPWPGLLPPRDAYAPFMAALGCSPITEEHFHPFFHEIVTVDPAEDPDQPAVLLGEHWPGYLVGSLLLIRAGVWVSAGRRVLDPWVATHSRLYWAWWRRYRPAFDPSHGWGSNSQWATAYRRDYLT